MQLQSATIYQLHMDLVSPFSTSFGTQDKRHVTIISLSDSTGLVGYGECVSMEDPLYTEEFMDASIIAMKKYFIPIVLNANITHPDDVSDVLKGFKRNNMGKAGLEGAVWDLYAKQQGKPLHQLLCGQKTAVEVGVSLGLEPTDEAVVANVTEKVAEGYKRIKVKIKPGRDIELLRKIRAEHPDIPLMADANSAYTLNDIETLKAMDEFNLMMIEQPLADNDLIEHSQLQKQITTPICLDESIDSYKAAQDAIYLNACKIFNLKIGRVGGITESLKIHELARKHNIPMWCGGMLESGVGRMHNIAITTLSNFSIPGDTSSSNRYWHKDIIVPPVVAIDGVVPVSDTPGIGADIDWESLREYLVEETVIEKGSPVDMIFK